MDSYLKTDLASSQSGFSLIEVLIAMGILALSMLAAASMQFSSIRNNASGNMVPQANMLDIVSIAFGTIYKSFEQLNRSTATDFQITIIASLSVFRSVRITGLRNEKAPGPEGAWQGAWRFFCMDPISLI